MSDKEKDLELLATAFFDNLQIDDNSFGAIGVDSKRPFGNSYVVGDILEIIDADMESEDEDGDPCYSDGQKDYARDLYTEDLIPYLQKEWAKRF